MKLEELPDDIAVLCRKFPKSLGTRRVLTMITKKICPEVRNIAEIKEFLSGVTEIHTQKRAKPAPVNNRRTRRADNADGPTVTVKVNMQYDQYGYQSFTERRYLDNFEYEIPAEIVAEGEDAVRDYIEYELNPWDEDFEYGDMDTGDTNVEGEQNREISFINFSEAEEEAQQIIDEQT